MLFFLSFLLSSFIFFIFLFSSFFHPFFIPFSFPFLLLFPSPFPPLGVMESVQIRVTWDFFLVHSCILEKHRQRCSKLASGFRNIYRLQKSCIAQPRDHSSHLFVWVDPEAFLLCHRRQLDVLGVQLFLHHLLQRLQHQRLGLLESQRLRGEETSADTNAPGGGGGGVMYTVILVLQFGLGSFTARADGLCIVSVESAGGFGVVTIYSPLAICCIRGGRCNSQLRAVLVVSGNQQCYTERP